MPVNFLYSDCNRLVPFAAIWPPPTAIDFTLPAGDFFLGTMVAEVNQNTGS
jgi:hypothetical protein